MHNDSNQDDRGRMRQIQKDAVYSYYSKVSVVFIQYNSLKKETTKSCCFGGNRHSTLSGTSAQPFLEPLVILLWILGTYGFPWIVILHWVVSHLSTNPDHGCLT